MAKKGKKSKSLFSPLKKKIQGAYAHDREKLTVEIESALLEGKINSSEKNQLMRELNDHMARISGLSLAS